MTTADVFAAALGHLETSSAEPALLPDRLTRACVAALPQVDGAGLSYTFTADRRLPVGASDPVAATAERLQFALGEGPCLTAQRQHRLVRAALPELQGSWPVYAGQLVTGTPFRGVVAVPVGGPLGGVAGIDLYVRSPDAVTTLSADDVQTVADLVGAALADDLATADDRLAGTPSWLTGPSAEAREKVWIAVGYLAGQRACTTSDALALLRAHAFTHDLDLERAAELVLAGELPTG